jgi:hypothetical protein
MNPVSGKAERDSWRLGYQFLETGGICFLSLSRWKDHNAFSTGAFLLVENYGIWTSGLANPGQVPKNKRFAVAFGNKKVVQVSRIDPDPLEVPRRQLLSKGFKLVGILGRLAPIAGNVLARQARQGLGPIDLGDPLGASTTARGKNQDQTKTGDEATAKKHRKVLLFENRTFHITLSVDYGLSKKIVPEKMAKSNCHHCRIISDNVSAREPAWVAHRRRDALIPSPRGNR